MFKLGWWLNIETIGHNNLLKEKISENMKIRIILSEKNYFISN